MRITNNAGLPEAIVKAVTNDPYVGGGDISCTRLIGPPMISHLTRLHQDELEEDAADRIWALVGQAIHQVIERAAGRDELEEERIGARIGGHLITGQFDLFDGTTLTDFKVTSVWSAKQGVKPEWEAQLNVLAHLMLFNGFHVERLQVVAILRDWRKNEALKYGVGDYPQKQAVTLAVRPWSFAQRQEFVLARLAEHFAAEPRPCTPEERWDQVTTYAVKKQGRKTALRVFNDRARADELILGHKDEAKLYVEERPGQSVRCLQYCSVAQWCDYGRTLNPQPQEESDDDEASAAA